MGNLAPLLCEECGFLEPAREQLALFEEGGASGSGEVDVSPSLDFPVDDSLGESAPIKARRQPAKPSPEEVRLHETSHYPYRDWCRHCVAGCGRRHAHKTTEGNTTDESIATIAMDYAFFCDDVDKDRC